MVQTGRRLPRDRAEQLAELAKWQKRAVSTGRGCSGGHRAGEGPL